MKRSIRIAAVVATTAAMMSAAGLAVVGIGTAVSAQGGDTTIVADAAVVSPTDSPVSSPVELTSPAASDFRVPAIDKALRVVAEHVATTTTSSPTTTATSTTSAATSTSTDPSATVRNDDSHGNDDSRDSDDEHEGQDD